MLLLYELGDYYIRLRIPLVKSSLNRGFSLASYQPIGYSKTHHSNDHFSVSPLHTCLQEEQETGGSRMLTGKPLSMSEKVLCMVAGPMAVVLTIAALVIAIFYRERLNGTVRQ
jgi:hypothetical protein